MLIRLLLAAYILIFCGAITQAATSQPNDEPKCVEAIDKNLLLSGWYIWEPYQFNRSTPTGYKLAGMDVELLKHLANQVGMEISYQQVNWANHQNYLEQGKIDLASGVTRIASRHDFIHFSIPYRYEEDSLFVLKKTDKKLVFSSLAELLVQIRLQNFKIGLTKGYMYAEPHLNLFITDTANRDIVKHYSDDVEALKGLLKGEIDGFIADKVVGAAAIVSNNANEQIKELPLNIKTPVHLAFSKKTVPLEIVDKFNREIKAFISSDKYRSIIKTHLYPVLLLQTIDSYWFYLIGILGTLGFSISGIAIAAKDNSTLFGTFLFALIPTLGGGITREILISKSEVGLFITPSYIYYTLVTVLIGFSAVRLFEHYNKNIDDNADIARFWDHVLIIGDSLGQAAFVVIGVCIAIMARIEPIELWGPAFAFLTASGGCIIRDLMRKKHQIICLNGALNAELSVIWGLIFSIYLDFSSYNPDPNSIRNVVIIVALGAFLTRLAAFYLNIPNLKFRADKLTAKSENLD